MRDSRRVFARQMTLESARRAEVFPLLLEDVRAARAETKVLLQALELGTPPLGNLREARARCEKVAAQLDENHRLMSMELRAKLSAFVRGLEEAHSELTLCCMLGVEDASGERALARARRTVQVESARLEASIRAEMAALVLSRPGC